MKKNKTIAVLRGGLSLENEVSNSSANFVIKALKSIGYNTLDINVDHYFLNWAIKNKGNVDIFFNALHGKWGEDGKIQGVLEYLKVPYTHSGVTASAIGMDKELSKKIFKNGELKFLTVLLFLKKSLLKKDPLKRPYIIKPICEGSSLGVHIISKNKQITKILKDIKENKILAEEYICGSDYTVALMNGKCLGILEILPNESFYNYSAKYKNKKTKYRYPKKTDQKIISKIIKLAKIANKQIKATSITRVDFRVNEKKGENGIYALEINTQPGLTRTSLVPKIAKQSGINFESLIDRIVKNAKVNKN